MRLKTRNDYVSVCLIHYLGFLVVTLLYLFLTLRFPKLRPRSVLCRASAESDWTIGPAVSTLGSKLGLSNLLPAAFA